MPTTFDGSVSPLQLVSRQGESKLQLKEIFAALDLAPDVNRPLADRLPFCGNDVTAGSEMELQAAVAGRRQSVDLPQAIERSHYFAHIIRRAKAGDSPARLVTALERFLTGNEEQVWDNSWVRFPRRHLSPLADQVLRRDLLADKSRPEKGLRSDRDRYVVAGPDGEETLRLPISYLVKLALADVLGRQPALPELLRSTGWRLLDHFLNDNTSPETFSFHVLPLRPEAGLGRAVGREAAKRFALTHLLVQYANSGFGLVESGQRAMIYAAPHPPQRQKELNELIPDALYRELFMSPCLSGWDRGEEKHRYMHLCHEVLSRSQLNAVAKLRDAGIISNNLVVLPGVSNTSLANNGTHISLGSCQLTARRAAGDRAYGQAEEKFVGDLAVKISEHFLPLFVGTYSAAPYRLGFADFHPEKALGFLSHELDFTHLRMLWRRWRKKASLSVFGRSVTPFGPLWLDRLFAGLFRLRGDYVPDFRLVDYPAWLLSSYQHPAWDGRLGNQERLKQDLAEMGVFDNRMSLYMLIKLREFGCMGFTGFEGRQYSLFADYQEDMGRAADLQTLVTALAFKYMAQGRINHRHIPDNPLAESERRQMFFGAALGIPTFFVRRNSRNLLLRRILKRTGQLRASRRYPGYVRVKIDEYRKALLRTLIEDGSDLAESLDLQETLNDLRLRLEMPEHHGAFGKLNGGILKGLGRAAARSVPAAEFNRSAEDYFRGELRRRHLGEGFDILAEDLRRLDQQRNGDSELHQVLGRLLGGRSAGEYFQAVRRDLLTERAPLEVLQQTINLLLLTVADDSAAAARSLEEDTHEPVPAASVY
ncbi:MAG: hypothetical protein R2864_04155 [Syntrophotaleaceae bacterium]